MEESLEKLLNAMINQQQIIKKALENADKCLKETNEQYMKIKGVE